MSEIVAKQKNWALVGAPNSGKTTLYNWLTGSRFKTVNYPGATVEYSLGHLASHLQSKVQSHFTVMDTPGTYSLHPKSADEEVTLKAIYQNPELSSVDGILVVVDGTQLSRHLLLAEQVLETQFPMIIVVTMADLLRSQGLEIDLEYLKKRFRCQVLQFDGLLAGGLQEIVAQMNAAAPAAQVIKPSPWDFATQEVKLKEIEAVAQKALTHKSASPQAQLKQIIYKTQKLDSYLLHPLWGLVLFFTVMGLVFTSIFWLASPFMEMIDHGFGFLSQSVASIDSKALWVDFLANGIIASFGAVLVFVPQIFILFFAIGLLEGSGYLARAATLIDKPFSKLGMSGRSFVPILSGFACAVPALIATRNISSTRDRMITSFIIPLMTCSARLPVYALLLAFLFKGEAAWKAGLGLAALYMGSLLIGAIAAAIINKMIPEKDRAFFMMELPLYRRPKMRVLVRQALTRTYSYVKRAGPMIFIFSVMIWIGTNFPHHDVESAQQKLAESYAGQVGQVIEPVFKPMGVDWRVGVGLISAFAAREVFVSSLAVVFNVTDTDETSSQNSLLTQMKSAVNSQGQKIFTVASVVGLMIFFMIALQCMSTFAMAQKETGSLKFALAQLVIFNVAAYIIAVAVVQTLSFAGLGA